MCKANYSNANFLQSDNFYLSWCMKWFVLNVSQIYANIAIVLQIYTTLSFIQFLSISLFPHLNIYYTYATFEYAIRFQLDGLGTSLFISKTKSRFNFSNTCLFVASLCFALKMLAFLRYAAPSSYKMFNRMKIYVNGIFPDALYRIY